MTSESKCSNAKTRHAGRDVARTVLVGWTVLCAALGSFKPAHGETTTAETERAVFRAADPYQNQDLLEKLRHKLPVFLQPGGKFVPNREWHWVPYAKRIAGSDPRMFTTRLYGGGGGFFVTIMAFDNAESASRLASAGGEFPNDRLRLVGDRYIVYIQSLGSDYLREPVLNLFVAELTRVIPQQPTVSTPPPDEAANPPSRDNPSPPQEPPIPVPAPEPPPPEPVAETPPPDPLTTGPESGEPPPDSVTSDGEISSDDSSGELLSPETLAGAALLIGGLATLGAWLTMAANGIGLSDVYDGAREWFGGTPAPEPPPPPATHHDGEGNEAGEVWSDEDRGWVGRNLYDEERGRRTWIADKNEADLRAGQSEDVKQAYDEWQDSKKKLAEVQEQGRLLEKRERLREWVEQSEEANAEQSYWSDVKNNFVVNVDKEFNELPKEAFELCREAAKAAKAGVDAAVDIAKDATNWEILRATGAQTAKDLIGSPIQSLKKVNKLYTDGVIKVGGMAVTLAAHPIDTIKAISGYDNSAQALDYHVPLSKRIGYALLGTVDTASAISGFVSKPVTTGLRAAEGAEAALDVAKADAAGAKLERAAAKAAEDAARQEAWLLGEQQAKHRVAKLASSTSGEMRAAVLEIQGDKRAIQMLNRESNEMKAAFNREIRQIYRETDDAVKIRLHDSLAKEGVDLEKYEIQASHATNKTPDPFKVGADRDITYSLYDKKGNWVRDVPANKVQEVYNEEFYRATHGHPPPSAEHAADFAKKMDQQCVDATHAEAYGRGPKDLNTALNQPGTKFSDPTQVGKVVAFKSHEYFVRAEEAAKLGKAAEAEKLASEGIRQTTKQFDNMLVRRHGALAEAGAAGLQEIPDRMKSAIEMLKTGEKGVSPVSIENQLRSLGYGSPRDVATHVGEYIEAMDKLRPKI